MTGLLFAFPKPVFFPMQIFEEWSMFSKPTTHKTMKTVDETRQKRIITEVADEGVQKWTVSETLQKLQEQIKELEDSKKNLAEAIKQNTNKELIMIAVMEKRIATMKGASEHLHKKQIELQKQQQKKIETLEMENKKLLSETKRLNNERNMLSVQKEKLLSERMYLTNKNDTLEAQLLCERKQWCNEKDCLAKTLKQAKDKTHSLDKQLKDSRRTIQEMGFCWLIRVLCPQNIAVDCCFFVFTFAYLCYKLRS